MASFMADDGLIRVYYVDRMWRQMDARETGSAHKTTADSQVYVTAKLCVASTSQHGYRELLTYDQCATSGTQYNIPGYTISQGLVEHNITFLVT